MHLPVPSRGFLKSCIVLVILLNLANAASVYLRFVKGADFGWGIIPLFDFDTEGNFPTLFNGALLAFAAVVAMTIGLHSRANLLPYPKSWLGAALILTFLAFGVFYTIEENLEFAGCILAGFALLKWLEERVGATRVGLQLG